MFHHGPWIWGIFNAFVIAMLVLDLFVLHRKHQAVGFKAAMGWTAFWIGIALAFGAMLWLWGQELGLQARAPSGEMLSESRTAIQYLTAYLVEKSLSMDNIFVFLVIFRYFGIPGRYQHEVLFWGIFGALVMRLTFILAGVALLQHFEWVIYIFGAILLYTGVQMWRGVAEHVDPSKNPILRALKRFLPVTHDLGEGRFLVRQQGVLYATPLLVALLAIETTDVVFAVDSVPAVLGITQDAFIAYSSNVFAILGLRALYFALAAVMGRFKDLHYGLAFLLIFLGGKMVVDGFVHLPEWFHWVSLGVVFLSVTVAIVTSLVRHGGEDEQATAEAAQAMGQPPTER